MAGLIVGLAMTAILPAGARDFSRTRVKESVESVLADQARAWNRGDIEGFMNGYTRSPGLRFASGGDVTRGWQSTLERYKKRYSDRAAMGELSFSDLETTVLSADAALVFGRWRLKTSNGEPQGLFTLLFRRQGGAWRIVADHTSAAPTTGKK